MLETEEVEDDYFTPVAGTSLANIFGSAPKNKDSTGNDSLKYFPPKPQNIPPKKKEQGNAAECIIACALSVLEWCNNVYTSRGKLGFAIVKILKTGDHNIVLYDSNKTTLSCTNISPKLEVSLKNNSYISYYDSLKKYWSVYGTEDETKKITELLIKLGAKVNYSSYTDKGLPEPNNPEIKDKTTSPTKEVKGHEQKGSDTDSSMNRKTKASILNRMANMGLSVLPTRSLPTELTSDSSDTHEFQNQLKTSRHKTNKSSKRNNLESIVSETQLSDPHQRIVSTKTESENSMNVYNSQLMTSFDKTNNDFGMFMSEQRISNSELRVNINRITDKVDTVLDKINYLEHKDKNTNVYQSSDILLRLLTEYENKIKIYEELLRSRGIDEKKVTEERLKHSDKDNEVQILKNKAHELEKDNETKSHKIHHLKREIKLIKEKYTQESLVQNVRENELLARISALEEELKCRNTLDVSKDATANTTCSNDNFGGKIKNIMNETFQTISMNFESYDVYTGETIKRIVGTVIKKITIRTLSEL